MKAKAVIFDLDGTLFDSIADIAESNNKMLRNNNLPVHTLDKYVEWIGNGALKLVVSSLPEELQKAGAEEHNKFLKEYSDIYFNNVNVKSSLYNGIPEVLDFLQSEGVKMAINTNKPHDITLKVVEHYLNKWNFEFVIGQRTGYEKKPNLQAAHYIAEKLEILPEEVLFIGDSKVDADTGKNAGMKTIGVTWGYDKIDSNTGFDYLVSSPDELIDILRKKVL